MRFIDMSTETLGNLGIIYTLLIGASVILMITSLTEYFTVIWFLFSMFFLSMASYLLGIAETKKLVNKQIVRCRYCKGGNIYKKGYSNSGDFRRWYCKDCKKGFQRRMI